jgi:hypothetical protein
MSLVFLAGGICAIWFVQRILKVEGEAVLVALLVVPLVLYLTLSGRVREIAAGNLNVKLNEASREPVGQAATEYVTADLGPRSDPYGPITKTDPNLAQVVTLTHGSGPYEREEVLDHLTTLAAMRPVPFLIVLDSHERVLAYMTYRSAIDVLDRSDRGDLFIKLVNEGDPNAFDMGGGFSAVRTETLMNNATNGEALSTMEKTGLEALVVVDRKGRFGGIVERERLLTRMMLTLVSPSSPT